MGRSPPRVWPADDASSEHRETLDRLAAAKELRGVERSTTSTSIVIAGRANRQRAADYPCRLDGPERVFPRNEAHWRPDGFGVRCKLRGHGHQQQPAVAEDGDMKVGAKQTANPSIFAHSGNIFSVPARFK
jgi:hypothetical protein